MIRTIRLTNFQSHASTSLDLDPGLNVITGPSDSGKTAVIRALKWALYNEPRGDAFVRAGEKSCEVVVSFADGGSVIRARRGKANEYRIALPSGEEFRFEAFGADPPAEVAQVSGMPKVLVGDREIAANFAYQLEGPFLLSESPLTAAKVLGKLAGTEEVDHAGKMVSADLFRRRQEERRHELEAERLEAELHQYDHLPEMEATIARLEEISATVRQGQGRLSRLVALCSELQALSSREFALTARLSAIRPACDLSDALGALESGFQRLARLITLAGLSSEQAAGLSRAQGALSACVGVLKAELGVLMCSVLKERFATLQGLAARLGPVESSMQTYTARLVILDMMERADAPAIAARTAADRLRTLSHIHSSLACNQATREDLRTGIDRAAAIVRADAPIGSAIESQTRLAALWTCQGRLADTEADHAVISGRVNRANQIVLAAGPAAEVTELRVRHFALAAAQTKLANLDADTVSALNQFSSAYQAVTTYKQSYVNVLVEIGTCPVCGSSVNPSKLKEVLSVA